jgi:hypothetical protein
MKTRLTRFAILAAILAEVWWSLQIRNLSVPRSEQTIAAIHAFQASSTPQNKAAMLEQMHRDIARNILHGRLQLGLMLLADIAAIYFFWNYGVKKNAA